jgi:Zn-dependent protease with chaperone function
VDWWVYLPLYVGFAFAAVTPRIARILPPRTGVWCLTTAGVTAAVSWVVSLALIAFTGLGRLPYVATEGHWSVQLWRKDDPVGVWPARVTGLILAAVLLLFLISLGREIVSLRQIRRLTGRLATDDLLVFVDDEEPHAYAVGGRHPRIVISRGLLRGMSVAERRAVLAHETAHVRYRHDVHLRIIRLAAAINPLLRPFVPAGGLAVERWADEDTAASLGDRALVARALLRAALAGAANGRRPRGALAHADGDVGRRVSALMQAPPPPRRSMTAITLLLLVATITAPVFAADNVDAKLNQASQVKVTGGVRHHFTLVTNPQRLGG